MRTRPLLVAVAAALVATALAGGIGSAAIPGADGVISGCRQKNEGQLRVIDPAADRCRPSEFPISWNAQGVRGEKGDPGAPGQDGVDGQGGTSVTVAPEPPGANCAAGGAKVTAASGVTYVCSGLELHGQD